MKLYSSLASPFGRKVKVLAREVGLYDRLAVVNATLTPLAPDDAVNAQNPLGKIPCLVTDEFGPLYDSRVICEYLDGLHGGPRMIAPNGAARWTALRRQALGDGILDAGVGLRYETVLRPEALRWPGWIDAQHGKIARALDALALEAGGLADEPDIGTITVGCALGYLDFRYAGLDWRSGRTELAGWYGRFAERPSMRATIPS